MSFKNIISAQIVKYGYVWRTQICREHTAPNSLEKYALIKVLQTFYYHEFVSKYIEKSAPDMASFFSCQDKKFITAYFFKIPFAVYSLHICVLAI